MASDEWLVASKSSEEKESGGSMLVLGLPSRAVRTSFNRLKSPGLDRRRQTVEKMIIFEGSPTLLPPRFCVSAGIIGLTGEWRRCTGIIGVSRGKSEDEAKSGGLRRSEMVQQPRPGCLRPG